MYLAVQIWCSVHTFHSMHTALCIVCTEALEMWWQCILCNLGRNLCFLLSSCIQQSQLNSYSRLDHLWSLAQTCFHKRLLSRLLLLINPKSLWLFLCHGSVYFSQIPEPSNACYPIVMFSANQLLANFGSSIHKAQICIIHIVIFHLWPKEDKYNTSIIEKRSY